MHINIPPADQQELARLAVAAGYDDVERYVADHVRALVRRPGAESLAPLTPSQLRASLEACDRSMAEFNEGRALTAQEARERTLAELNRPLR